PGPDQLRPLRLSHVYSGRDDEASGAVWVPAARPGRPTRQGRAFLRVHGGRLRSFVALVRKTDQRFEAPVSLHVRVRRGSVRLASTGPGGPRPGLRSRGLRDDRLSWPRVRTRVAGAGRRI